MPGERRRNEQFRVKEGAIAALSLPGMSKLQVLGQIKEIGKGGLSLRYIASEDRTKGLSQLQIFWYEDPSPLLDSVRCRVVYDSQEYAGGTDASSVRRCGIQFEELSTHQLAQLDSFIEHYTTGEHHPPDPMFACLSLL